jgi:ERCC4-type nuclease
MAEESNMPRLVQAIGTGLDANESNRDVPRSIGSGRREPSSIREQTSYAALRRETVDQALEGIDARLEEAEGTLGCRPPLAVELSALFEEVARVCEDRLDASGRANSHWLSNLLRASSAAKHHRQPVNSLSDARRIKYVGDAVSEYVKEYFNLRHPHLLPSPELDRSGQPSQPGSTPSFPTQQPSSNALEKAYVPPYGTGNFAILVTMHRLELQGQPEVTKQTLQYEAEATGIARNGILPDGNATFASNSATRNRSNNSNGRQCFQYSGWSGFNARLKKTPRGYSEPLVHTRSCPMLISLTESGRTLAQSLHAHAEWKEDCTCGLVEPQKPAAPVSLGSSRKRKHVDDGLEDHTQNYADCYEEMNTESRREDRDGREEAQHSGLRRTGNRKEAHTDTESEYNADPLGVDGNDSNIANSNAESTLPRPFASRPFAPWLDKPLRVPPLHEGEKFSDRYTIVLLLDNRENIGAQHMTQQQQNQTANDGRDELLTRLTTAGVHTEKAVLKKGDALWVARDRVVEYALDVIIERKRVDDLVTSIQDGRWQTQKKHLREGVLRRPMLVLEGDPYETGSFKQTANTDAHAKAVRTALACSEQLDGMHVMRTASQMKTVRLLQRMTDCIKEHLESRSPSCIEQHPPKLADVQQHFMHAEQESESVKQCFGKVLCSLVSVGPKQAEAIVARYPTPSSLYCAYVASEEKKRPYLLKSIMLPGDSRSVGPKASEMVFKSFFCANQSSG